MKSKLAISLLLLPTHLLLWWGTMQLCRVYPIPFKENLFHVVVSYPALASCILWLWFLQPRTPAGCLWFCGGLPLLTGFASSLIIIHTMYPAESMSGYVVLICLFYNLLCCLLLPLLRLLTRRKKGENQSSSSSNARG